MEKRCYLATTGLSEIWDLDNKLLLLGPWCLTREDNKKILEKKEYHIVSSPWKPAYKIKEAADYCHNIYENLLPQLTEILNTLHNVRYPVKYWQILIGSWLLHFIEVFYDRYMRIKNVLDSFPDFYSYVLPLGECKIFSSDNYDFLSIQINQDLYNLKLFSIITSDLCPEHISKAICILDKNEEAKKEKTTNLNWKGDLINLFLKMSYSALAKTSVFKGSVVLCDMYHLSLFDILKLKFRFRQLGYINFDFTKNHLLAKDYSSILRKEIFIRYASDRFQSLLFRILPDAIPTCYMENYKFYKQNLANLDRAKVKIVGSAVGWCFNERFKFFAAESVVEGVKTIDFQCGGGYGFFLAMPLETISLEKDIFYTWGWNSKKDDRIKPLPSSHLSKLKDTCLFRDNKILFIGTGVPKYHYRFFTYLLPDDIPKYFEDKIIFLKLLSPKIKENIVYRPYTHDLGWKEKEVIKEACSYIKFAAGGININLMRKVKLVIIDHPSTSFIEALVINVPCVFYWDHDVNLIRPEAEKYFELLRNAGILYKDPTSAAKKVNEIFESSMDWWLSKEIQTARMEFCGHFAYVSKDWMNVWAKELNSIK